MRALFPMSNPFPLLSNNIYRRMTPAQVRQTLHSGAAVYLLCIALELYSPQVMIVTLDILESEIQYVELMAPKTGSSLEIFRRNLLLKCIARRFRQNTSRYSAPREKSSLKSFHPPDSSPRHDSTHITHGFISGSMHTSDQMYLK